MTRKLAQFVNTSPKVVVFVVALEQQEACVYITFLG